MKQAIRALGWAVSILWIILLLFTVTAVYSAFQIRPSFGEFSAATSGSTLTASIPLILNNGGFYDISKFNITTQIRDFKGTTITRSSTFASLVPAGANATITHSMSLTIEQAATSNLSHLLFDDSDLEVEAAVRLTYAKAFPFELSVNMSMPWGAPFANLVLGDILIVSFDPTQARVRIPLSFENHSFLTMNGTMQLEIVDYTNHVVGIGSTGFNAPPDSRFETNIETLVSGDPGNVREARLYFETPFFSYGPTVMSLV